MSNWPGSGALLDVVCAAPCHRCCTRHADAALTPPVMCELHIHRPCCGSRSLQQSHVRFMPLPDVSWLYKKEMKVDLQWLESEGAGERGGKIRGENPASSSNIFK